MLFARGKLLTKRQVCVHVYLALVEVAQSAAPVSVWIVKQGLVYYHFSVEPGVLGQ